MSDNIQRVVRIFDDSKTLTQSAAQMFIDLAQQKQGSGEPFSVALSGGSTPAALYALLAAPPYHSKVQWDDVHLWFGDERCVPPDDENSNFHTVQTELLSRSPNPIRNVHRMPADLPDPNLAAQQYEDELMRFFKLAQGQFPRFDLVLMGMGPDGHTASLFPNMPSLHEQTRLVIATPPGHEPLVERLTLTYPVLNNGANILFLVEKADKADMVARVLEGPAEPDALPSQNVRATNGTLTWFLDRAAASKLKKQE